MVTRILILGGGFAGVYTARALFRAARAAGLDCRSPHDLDHPPRPGRDSVEVHMVNRENYMVFQPMLPEVVSASVGVGDTVSPLRRLIPGIVLHVRDVESIDLAARTVTCSPGMRPRHRVLPYDHLVLALGNVTDFRGMPGLHEHAMPFKNLGDAIALRNHLIGILEEADAEADPAYIRHLLSFVVAGGGFSGVEAMGEIHSFIHQAIGEYPRLSLADARFTLVHSRDRILPEVAPELAYYAQRILQRRGIDLRLNTSLVAATADAALLDNGDAIPTKTLVSTVPSSPNPLIDTLDLPKVKGRLLVDAHLRVQGDDHLWAVGDCAMVPIATENHASDSHPQYAPPTAQHAVREARVCGQNVIAAITGRPLRSFQFAGLGTLANLGGHVGVAQIVGRIKLSGILAWFLWRTVYWAKLPGLYRKARVGMSWALDLFFPPDLVQLQMARTGGISEQHFEPGQYIYVQGDLGDRVYIILTGKAEVVRRTDGDGRAAASEQQIAVLGPGEYFGEMALLGNRPRSASIRCLEPMNVLSIGKSDFRTMMTHFEQLRGQIEETAARRQNRDAPASAPQPRSSARG